MVSTVRFNQWQDSSSNNQKTVIQVVTSLVNDMSTWSSPSASQTVVTPLSISITPKYVTSKIVIQWMINGEMHYNNVFRIFKNGSLAPNGRNLYNASSWNGYVSSFYDWNDDTTPFNFKLLYADLPGTTSSTTYQIAVGSSSSVAYTFALNRCLNAAAADAVENMVSSVVAWEIAQ